MNVHFTKMHGLGNDFMVIDGINQKINLMPEQIKQWSDRRFGIGFDQLLLVEKPLTDQAEFHYRIYNADGSEVEQCGNGARCFARFVVDKGLTTSSIIPVETNTGMIKLELIDDLVKVDMGAPDFRPASLPFDADHIEPEYLLDVHGIAMKMGAVSMGNPHAVLRVEDIEKADVETLGPAIEGHIRFPNRVNVGFMQVIDRTHISLRVYERGAGETLACGTGACAAVVSGIQRGWLDPQVRVSLAGGDLNISWPGGDAPVLMTGPATTVFEGQIDSDSAKQ